MCKIRILLLLAASIVAMLAQPAHAQHVIRESISGNFANATFFATDGNGVTT
jgi:hypothetical protein